MTGVQTCALPISSDAWQADRLVYIDLTVLFIGMFVLHLPLSYPYLGQMHQNRLLIKFIIFGLCSGAELQTKNQNYCGNNTSILHELTCQLLVVFLLLPN